MAAPLAVLVGAKVPQVGPHDAPPCTAAQVAPLPAGSKLTVAVNCCVALTGMRADPGETAETVIAGMVMFAEPVFEWSATEVAVRVTVRLLAGASAGAW